MKVAENGEKSRKCFLCKKIKKLLDFYFLCLYVHYQLSRRYSSVITLDMYYYAAIAQW